MKIISIPALAAAGFLAAPTGSATVPWQLTVQADRPGPRINPGFYGLMTEEINHSYDGGLYAELIQNRSFKDSDQEPVHWSLVEEGDGSGRMSLDRTDPLNAAQGVSLKLEITAGGRRVGVANEGFCNFSRPSGGRDVAGPGGLPVRPDTTYDVAFYAKASPEAGPLTVSLESRDGKTRYAEAVAGTPGPGWRKFTAKLQTGANVTPGLDNLFVISTTRPGTVWLSFVSLFPPTYKNRPNGNRVDIMEKLAAMKPAFLRFPGGNYVDPGHYLWKNTIGPVEQRPGSPGAWEYRTGEGLGLLEFFLWCEDLNMEPVLAVSVGRNWLPARGDVAPLVQDALDEIEYVTGDAGTPWGAKRAADGHPAPFKLRYVEIGNEDWFDPKKVYDLRFPKFFDAIKAKYPQLQVISTRNDMTLRTPGLIDDHLYANAYAMARAGAAYDHYDRSRPKVFVGEWATQDGIPTPTLRGALGDAAYLTGLERNADVIEMACYAPLFTSVLPNGSQWPTNLIGYDALTSFGSPSYHMQVMFSENKGDVVLPAILTRDRAAVEAGEPPPTGGVGVGTWETQAEFKDAKVTRDGDTLLEASLGTTPDGWTTPSGQWTVRDGAFRQSGPSQLARALSKAGQGWTDYTYTVKARKTGGPEGFLIFFHVKDERNFIFWNLGGWGNDHSALEQTVAGTKEQIGEPAGVRIDTGRWYDIKIEVKGKQIRCFLDGKLITQATDPAGAARLPVYASAAREDATGDVILKVVNLGEGPQTVNIDVLGAAGIAPRAEAVVLTGDPDAVNSVAESTRVTPRKETVSNAGKTFNREFPGSSVTVLRLKTVAAAPGH